jgi:hypothetical protein
VEGDVVRGILSATDLVRLVAQTPSEI